MIKFGHLTREERLACINTQIIAWELPLPVIGEPFEQAGEKVLFALVVKMKELEDQMKELKK